MRRNLEVHLIIHAVCPSTKFHDISMHYEPVFWLVCYELMHYEIVYCSCSFVRCPFCEVPSLPPHVEREPN